MNREKHLNKADRKTATTANDSATQTFDDNHGACCYRPAASSVAVNNTKVKARQQCYYQLPEISGCDSARLNSDRLNAEVDSVVYHDLTTSHNQKAQSPSALYQRQTVSNSEGYETRQKLSNRKKKKEKNYTCGFDGSIPVVVPVNSEDDAVGFVDSRLRCVDHSSGRQRHTEVQCSQPIMLQNDQFCSNDHSLSFSPFTSIAAHEKVLHQTVHCSALRGIWL